MADNKNFMWANLVHLGSNMWNEEGNTAGREHRSTPCASPVLLFNRECWDNHMQELKDSGVNTLILDIGEAMRYESHPEIAVEGAWDHDKMFAEIEKLQGMGFEIVPKLNFSSCHDVWLKDYSRMLSTPIYYQVCQDLIREVCEVFKPKYFHLGMDEEDLPTHRKGMTIIRCDALWCHDLYFYMDCVQKNGARPWIWGDFYWAHPDVFKKKIPKECLISNWWYERLKTDENGAFLPKKEMDTYVALSELGYDQIPCTSTWCCHQNVAQTILFFKEKGILDDPHLQGFMVAPWTGISEVNRYELLDDAYRLQQAFKMLK